MQTLSISLFATSLLLAVSAQRNSTCGPFQITSTHGALYDLDNGLQYAGPSGITTQETEFMISPDGIVTDSAGNNCTFALAMLCDPGYPADPNWYIGQYGMISYRGSEDFYDCPAGPAAGVSSLTTQTSITVTPSATTATSGTSSLITPVPSTIRLQYIFPNNLADALPLMSQCEKISLQASRCQQGELDASNAGLPSATPTQSSSSTPSAYTGSATNIPSVNLGLILSIFGIFIYQFWP